MNKGGVAVKWTHVAGHAGIMATRRPTDWHEQELKLTEAKL